MGANPEARRKLRIHIWIPGSLSSLAPRNDGGPSCFAACRNFVARIGRRRLSDTPGAACGRLRRRRPDRHPGALRRRQARHAARPARDRREQAGRRRHARDPRRAGAAGGRLQPSALHAFRIDQHGAVQEPRLQAQRAGADLADRELLLRPRGFQRGARRKLRAVRAVRQGASRRGQLRHARRRLGPGDPGAADRKARRHQDEPHSVPQRSRRSCRI